jgi:predicted DNA-binding transcriptional regulator AlpA
MSANNHPEPVLLPISDLCCLLSISRSSFFSLKSAGRIGPVPVRLSSKQLYLRSEIESWLLARDARTGSLPTREQWLAMQGGDR